MDERDRMRERCHQEGHRKAQWPNPADGVFRCRWCGDPIIERSYSSAQIEVQIPKPHPFEHLQAGDPNYCGKCGEGSGAAIHAVTHPFTGGERNG